MDKNPAVDKSPETIAKLMQQRIFVNCTIFQLAKLAFIKYKMLLMKLHKAQ